MSPSHGLLLRLEGAAVCAAVLWAYAALDGSWLLFGALVLVPDLSMVGYLAGARVGAASYNVAHTYLFPAGLMAAGLVGGWEAGLFLALIAAGHIGMDRALGYGLKHPTGFHDTHLSSPQEGEGAARARQAATTIG